MLIEFHQEQLTSLSFKPAKKPNLRTLNISPERWNKYLKAEHKAAKTRQEIIRYGKKQLVLNKRGQLVFKLQSAQE